MANSRARTEPIRTCIGCMKQDRKETMVRIAAGAGDATLDWAGRARGRGGYLHARDECLEGFVKFKAREFRSLRVKLDAAQKQRIVQVIRERLDRKPSLE